MAAIDRVSSAAAATRDTGRCAATCHVADSSPAGRNDESESRGGRRARVPSPTSAVVVFATPSDDSRGTTGIAACPTISERSFYLPEWRWRQLISTRARRVVTERGTRLNPERVDKRQVV